MGDMSSAIQRVAEDAGLSVVRSLVGHGVGRNMHEDPQVPNYGKPGKGPLLEEGMVLAVEPMTTAGRAAVRVGGDGWAIYSQDGSPAAHFEFTVAITGDGPRVLTPWHLPAGERAANAPASAFRRVPRALRSCYHQESCSMRGAVSRSSDLHDLVAAAATAARAGSRNPAAERDHEGKTVGQADVREMQDHPPPRSGAGDLPEQAPQAASGLSRWPVSQGSTSP